METGYPVSEIMTRDVVTVTSDKTIYDCARQMAQKKVGSAVVIDNDKVVGILTEQDISRKAVAKGLDSVKTAISRIMSKPVHHIPSHIDIYDAIVEMGKFKIKHLPIIENGKLLGIISFKDIIKIQPDLIDLASYHSDRMHHVRG